MLDIVNQAIDFSLITVNKNGKVSARNLYKFLELDPSQISRWLKSKIINNEFAIENEDYYGFDTVVEGNKVKDFELTPEFAKKLCMMSKTINGEKARNYFIKIEKIAKNQIAIKQETPSYQIEDPIARAEAWITEKKHTLALETKIKEDKSKVEFAETLLDTTNAIDMATCAKAMHLNIGRNKLFSFLREKKVLNSRNIPYQTQIDAGRFVVLESSFVHPKTGDNILTTKTLVTAKGQEYINRLLKDY